MSPNIFLFLERILELLASSHADQNGVRVSRTDLPSAPLQGRNINNNHTQQIYKPIAQRLAPIPNLQTEMAEQKGRTLYATIMTCYNERPLSQPEVPLSLSLCVSLPSHTHLVLSKTQLPHPTTRYFYHPYPLPSPTEPPIFMGSSLLCVQIWILKPLQKAGLSLRTMLGGLSKTSTLSGN